MVLDAVWNGYDEVQKMKINVFFCHFELIKACFLGKLNMQDRNQMLDLFHQAGWESILPRLTK
jgi:hypothetical protein